MTESLVIAGVSVKYAHYLQTINIISIQGGYSPLYVASQEGHTDVVDILLMKGADVNQTTTTEVCATINLCVYPNMRCILFQLPINILQISPVSYV